MTNFKLRKSAEASVSVDGLMHFLFTQANTHTHAYAATHTYTKTSHTLARTVGIDKQMVMTKLYTKFDLVGLSLR